MFRSKIWSEIDYLTLFLVLILIGFGVRTLAGASATDGTVLPWYLQLWFTQLKWAVIGLIVLIVILFFDYQTLIRYAPILYILGIIGLMLCFVPLFYVKSHGARSWIKIGPLPQIQTSEFAKLATILFLAKVLSAKKEAWYGLFDLMKPLAIGAIPSMIIVCQPDMGTALVFVPITLIMMFVAGLPYSYFLLMISPVLGLFGVSHDPLLMLMWVTLIGFILLFAIVQKVPASIIIPFLGLAFVSYFVIFEYGSQIWEEVPAHAKARVEGYLKPEMDLDDKNWNINQSKIALGSGGFWGKGFGKGTQSTLKFLPEYQHDFIFPVVGEQSGFIGAVILLSLFLLLLIRGMDTAVESKTLQGALLTSGVIAMFFSHILINVGMVTGLLPVTGLPLTFISYGGSFMLVNMIAVGLIMNIRMRGQHETLKDSIFVSRSQMSIPAHIPDDF